MDWSLGEKVKVNIRFSARNAMTVIPIKSLIRQNGISGVMIEESSNLLFRPVKTGFIDGDYIEVVEGLSIGDKVIFQ
jgi:HlyD family secretion protein